MTRLYKVHLLDSMAHIIANILEYLLYFPETKFIDNRITGVFPCRAVVKNPPPNAGDTTDLGLIPRSGRFPGGGNGNTLQYSCLENFMDRGVCQATVHAIPTESDTTEHTCTHSFLRCFIHIGRYRVLRKVPCAIHVCTLNHFSCVQLSAVLRTVSLSSVHGIF